MAVAILARIVDMLEAFQRDRILRKATECGIEIISEASRREVARRRRYRQHAAPRVPSSRGPILSTVFQDELPRLRIHLEAMRAEIEK
jgi:hypothetical protein